MRHAALAVLLASPLAVRAQTFEGALESGVPALDASVAAAKAVPQAPISVDLSDQFTGPSRVQGDLGSCHAFTAIALTEAAYFRRYGRRVRLSEADLFLRKRVLADPFLRGGDSGFLRADLRWILKHGVMPGDFYAAFLTRYAVFKARAFKFLARRDRLVAELLPESSTDDAVAARAKIRAELAGLEVRSASVLAFVGATARGALARGPVRCDEKRAARLIEAQLDAGRPVGVAMNTGWAERPVWQRDAGGEGRPHYFVVLGYDRTDAGLVFRTRNTWTEAAGGNPALYGQDLCAIYGLSWLE